MDDLLWIGPALIAGIAATRLGLPPMVGYLLCGFVLNLSGIYDDDRLTMIGNLGVTLLLFTIGLKLDLRSLFRPVIWAGTTIHAAIVVAVFGTMLYWMSLAGIQAFADIDIGKAMLVGFALSFSSTVFAVKTLEDKGEYQSRYGQIAIGVLIMQDIIAVVFLAASTGKLPSVWAVGLLGLIPLRFVLMQLLNRAGHSGELNILYGLALAFGGYALFEAVDIKGDLGALIIGAMLASHPLAGQVSKRLLGFIVRCFVHPLQDARPNRDAVIADAGQLQRVWIDCRRDSGIQCLAERGLAGNNCDCTDDDHHHRRTGQYAGGPYLQPLASNSQKARNRVPVAGR
jgi:predicted Kef-type K+ transport protein